MRASLSSLILASLIITSPAVGAKKKPARNRIALKNGQELFLNGTNVAWGPAKEFCDDINDLDTAWFRTLFENHEEWGANSVRWWLHADGGSLPYDEEGLVKEPTETQKKNIRIVLDMGLEHGVLVNLCLWSFDMLNNKGYGDHRGTHNHILTKDDNKWAYIDNWLTPIVEEFKDHPALLSWEVYNEPEGMVTDIGAAGWAKNDTKDPRAENVTMKIVQEFANQISSVIHDADENALVNVGSWSYAAMSGQFGYRNFYSDRQMIAAGGEENGIMDYYQVHYYNNWNDDGLQHSPFAHAARYWKLKKPTVIGEFHVGHMPGGFNPEDLFMVLYDNGYAGAWGWTAGSNWFRMKGGIRKVYDAHRADVAWDQTHALGQVPPRARPDNYRTAMGRKYTAPAPGLMWNDRDPNCDEFTVTGIATDPANGKLAWKSDGSFVYEPGDGFSGKDSFVYEVKDATGKSAQGTAAITICGPSGLHIRVNCGGDDLEDEGILWVSDYDYADGGEGLRTKAELGLTSLAEPAPEQAYSLSRSSVQPGDSYSFTFPEVPDGAFRIRLHFRDPWAEDDRKAKYSIEGKVVLDDYVIAKAAGGKKGAAIEDIKVTVSDGNGLSILCEPIGKSRVLVSAVEIISAGGKE